MADFFAYKTPMGEIIIAEHKGKITHLLFEDEKPPKGYNHMETSILTEANMQLQEYFTGKRRVFSLPLNPEGTDFMQRVWGALCQIPYGETRSYKDIALAIGKDKAYRAVGLANNKNPIPIFIPCHRVIGSGGKLVGYGGGIHIKEFLLKLENPDIHYG